MVSSSLTTLFCILTLFHDGVEAVITTEYLQANALNFTCTVLAKQGGGDDDAATNIMLLHGFPMFRVWWDPLLNYWEKDERVEDVKAVACDLRGYSPGASPDDILQYNYDILVSDVAALAVSAGFDNYHLLGHDHGAANGWAAARASLPESAKVLSYTALSVPHPDPFSAVMCNEDDSLLDSEQIIASNYFNQFSLEDSATRNNDSLTVVFQNFGLSLQSPQAFQKMLWWYNGSFPSGNGSPGYMALPRVVSPDEVPDTGIMFFVQATQQAIPLEPRPCVPQTTAVGPVTVPTLFVCGAYDYALYCTRPYATPNASLVPNYTAYTAETCGHDFFLEKDCQDPNDGKLVMERITQFVFGFDDDEGDMTSPSEMPDNDMDEGGDSDRDGDMDADTADGDGDTGDGDGTTANADGDSAGVGDASPTSSAVVRGGMIAVVLLPLAAALFCL